MKAMAQGEAGFTLIELIVVIIILGILAVAATSKYQDLRKEAVNATVHGIAAEIEGGSKINFAKCTVNSTATSCHKIKNCNATTAGYFLESGSLPDGYSIASNVACTGTNATCTLKRTYGGQDFTAEVHILCP